MTHSQRVAENKKAQIKEQDRIYRNILDLAEKCDARGDHVVAKQHRATADNYADTCMIVKP